MDSAELSDKQADSILDSTARINLWHGSIRSGKTIGSIIAWLTFVADAPPGPLAMIGKTKETLARNILDVIDEEIPGAISFTRGAPTARVLGRLVHVLGANDARSEGRIRGLTLAGAYADEASLYPEAFWTQLLGRLSVPGARLFATTNPEGPAHWLKRKYVDRAADLDMRAWHFRLADNPGLTQGYIDSISAEYTGLWRKRFIDGLWVAAEGAIYEALDDELHHAPAPGPEQWGQLWVGIDYGTSNPTHAVLLASVPATVDPRTGKEITPARLHAVSEWRHDGRAGGQLTDAALSRGLSDWLKRLKLSPDDVRPVLDPSAASLRAQLRADGWRHLRAANNSVLDGLRSTANLFAAQPAPRLVVDTERCPELWRELCGYVWDEKATERGEDAPMKQDDHGPDALRYAVMDARLEWRAWLGVPLEQAA